VARWREGLAIAVDLGHRTEIAYCLIGLAAAELEAGDFESSARLAGAAEAMRSAIGVALDELEEAYLGRVEADVAAALGDARLAVLTAEGRAAADELAHREADKRTLSLA
jgi:hypothetical protein